VKSSSSDTKTTFQRVFKKLRQMLLDNQTANLEVGSDEADHFALQADIGPATIRAWKGKVHSPKIPVAYVQIGKADVSYHLFGLYGNQELKESITAELAKRMQGKTCFNFKNEDAKLYKELNKLTAKSLRALKTTNYIK
jgi:hypothetical protein